ncbi:MAG: uroporphyrinogen-III synthase [Rhodospirillales bacterium]|nr:MAG: uroporphyrinogen-III synthase [Rhodospirillales bacterium]
MRVLITRPRDDAELLARALAGHGIRSLIAPMLEIVFLAGPPVALDGVQALLATSANGVRAFARRETHRDLPVYAVGPATAEEARRAGFSRVHVAGGDVVSLAARVSAELDPEAGTLVHMAGTAVAGDLAGALDAAGYTVRREILYQARRARGLPPEAIATLSAGTIDGVVLYSARTARTFADLVDRAGLAPALAGVIAFCLSPAVADAAAGLRCARMVVAAAPRSDVLVDVIVAAALGRADPHFVSPRRPFPC